jgi:DNA-binding GntR family transcriptional regulator
MSTAEAFLTGSVGAIPLRTAAVLDAIKRAILAGELQPGQSLVEAELAQRLGVSKTPVREALKTLAGAGLVTMSPYRGATVRAIDADTARAIYDMRLLLEPEAVRRAVLRAADHADAANRANPANPANPVHPAHPERRAGPAAGGPAGLAAARAALDRADDAADEAERSLANREFHRALYLDCGNPLLVGVLDDLRDQTALVSAAAWQQEPSWRQEAGEHRAILAAAAAGDADHAARLVAAHIGSFAARHFPGAGQLRGAGHGPGQAPGHRPGQAPGHRPGQAPGLEEVQPTGSVSES